MTTLLTAVISVVIFSILSFPTSVYTLGGSTTTIAVIYGANITVCGIVAEQQNQKIQCWRNGEVFTVFSNVSFETIAGGRNLLCGVRSGGFSLICFDPNFIPKRLYYNVTVILETLTIGDVQIYGLSNSTTQNVNCWRDVAFPTNVSSQFRSISAGLGFTCGVQSSTNEVTCWGNNPISFIIQGQFVNFTMSNIVVGGNHACGLNTTGFLICRGSNDFGQLNVPSNSNSAYEFSALALGANHTCALFRQHNSVICWGGGSVSMNGNVTNGVSFESIVAGLDFTCGLTTRNFSVICWGPGWVNNSNSLGQNQFELPLSSILPGPCVQSPCPCGIYPQSQKLCSGFGSICRSCDIPNSFPPVSPPSVNNPPQSSSPSRGLRRGLLAFAIVGSVGAFAGMWGIIYCLWTGVCCGKKKIHNSVQPTINHIAPQQSYNSPVSRSLTIRRQGSRGVGFRRQRSGTSSKHADRAEEFTFTDLALATNNFSLENKIGAGSFGVVYRGKLLDGHKVAIKRGEMSPKMKKFQEKETAFDSELEFLSRLHHKHLVRLVGYCEEREERLLVYEYMKNGALYDHLHDKKNVEKGSSPVNSWKMRIKISLDAARGIEYLHNYAVPPIIHRDIKSSNILLDSNWVARVSDFGLSLLGPESDQEYRPTKAAGTVGYIDPEYYGLNVLTAKSDVYGLGVVLLELLTGKRAIFKSDENGGEPMSLVDFAVLEILDGELWKILDKRVGPLEVNEVEGVELLAHTAVRCVNLEGRDRPTMTDIVSNLEQALGFIDDSHGSISSGGISIISE